MVVHEADRLHERVADRRADERKSSAPQILAERIRFFSPRRHRPMSLPSIHARPAADETPDVGVERAELVLDLAERAGVSHGALDLEAVPDDVRILEQA